MTNSNNVPNPVAPIFVLRLTRPTNKRRILHSSIYEKAKAQDISFQDIISKRQDFTEGKIILYIVGHAIPDGLFDPTGKILTEQEVATAIKGARNGAKTVIVWDVCYATSFYDIADDYSNKVRNEWGANYAHVFACQDYELTLLRDDGTTQFSEQLVDAVNELNKVKAPAWKWNDLETRLQQQLGTLQTPDIVWAEGDEYAPTAEEFGLYSFNI